MLNDKQLFAKTKIEASLSQFAYRVTFAVKSRMLDEGLIVEVTAITDKEKYRAVIYFLKSGATFDEETGIRITVSGGQFSKTFNYRKWAKIFVKQ